ncbi:unnamed protein product [marine sediment metagenome]|uniref:Uncharacterized protein n=1 Tax=marine sediment metagenome TaxID=412755 RepID=X0U6M8_9ZZZZ
MKKCIVRGREYNDISYIPIGHINLEFVLLHIDDVLRWFGGNNDLKFQYDDGLIKREDIKNIKNIKTKNDALINSRHNSDFVRRCCKHIMEGI